MHRILEDLHWRYATKKFDSSKIVSDEHLQIVKESLRLAASSYGLQPLKYLVVESKEIREKLVPASYGQMQVMDASHLLVLCSYKEIEDEHIDVYMNTIAATRKVPLESVIPFGEGIKSSLKNFSASDIDTWSSKQAYIALGQLLQTCASLRIDATPMEGFDPKQYGEILNLNVHNLKATLVCPIGYRHEDDSSQHKLKVRKSLEELFETV